MGVKMKLAYYVNENRIVSTDEVNNNLYMKENLLCKTPYCRVPITFTHGYNKKCGNETTWVRPYFKIKSTPHVANCPYNTAESVKIIARNSTPDLIEQINEGKYNFRLHITQYAIDSLADRLQTHANTSKDDYSSNYGLGKKFENRGNLETYLTTTKKIVLLRALVENNAVLKNVLTIEYKDKKYHGLIFISEAIE